MISVTSDTMSTVTVQESCEVKSEVRKTRLGLSLSERIKVIEARQMGKSMRQLAAQFGCGKTQILNTLAQKERYICEWEVMGRINPSIGARKRFRHSRNEKINRSVYDWYLKQISTGIRVTGPMLQKQARQYATQLGVANFGASNGWLANFRRFYNIVSYSLQPKKNTPVSPCWPPKTSSLLKYQGTELVSVPGYDENISKFSEVSNIENDLLVESKQNGKNTSRLFFRSEVLDRCNDYICKTHEVNISKMCSSSSQSSRLNQSEEYSSGKEELTINLSDIQKITPPPSRLINHRKRRLLQLEHQDESDSFISSAKQKEGNTSSFVEKKIPGLLRITSTETYFTEFLALARVKGLLTLTLKDDNGHDWVEIRQPVASYRVPSHGYPIHLSRLIVDSTLQYFIEVLGHCVRNGSLLHTDNSFNYSEATSVLGAFNGEYIVCAGVETVLRRASNGHMKTIQETGKMEGMYATLPDNRYRSLKCDKWIDNRLGQICIACQQAIRDYSNSPMDLRYIPPDRCRDK